MRLGIITDIHEHVENLRWALGTLRREGAERVVCLGDVCEDGAAIAETCALLAEAGVIGVWGNHDFGMCTGSVDELLEHFDRDAIAYLRTYRPRLRIEDCHFSHIEPCLDPESGVDLWSLPEPPTSHERLDRNWRAVPERRMFMGHLHTWFAASSDGVLDWSGASMLATAGTARYLVIVGPLLRGHCALLDTTNGEVHPLAR